LQNPEEKIDLTIAPLKGANLHLTNLQGAHLISADLACADLHEANLNGAHLQNAHLYGASLKGTDLIGAELQSSDLQEANLQGANLLKAELSEATLQKANLSNANLVGTRLWGATLHKTILTGAELFETQMAKWELKDVICEYAFFGNEEKVVFKSGEFERLYAGNNIIEIEYQDGISKLEFASLPALIQLIESHQSGVKLSPRRMETIGNTMRVSFLAEGHKQEDLPSLQIEAEKLKNLQRKLAKQVDENNALSAENNALSVRLTKTEGKLEATEKALLIAMTMSRSGDVININAPVEGIAGKVHNSTVKQIFNINTEAHNQEDIEREIDEAPNETLADAVKDSAKSLIKQLYAETKNGVKQEIAKSLVGMLGESIQKLPSLSTVLGQLS
jgi:uncharacterized protein YjbI with pentapeptide repeats